MNVIAIIGNHKCWYVSHVNEALSGAMTFGTTEFMPDAKLISDEEVMRIAMRVAEASSPDRVCVMPIIEVRRHRL